MSNQIVNPPGFGIAPGEHDCIVTARGGNLSQGYCYPFSLLSSADISNDDVTVSTQPGDVGFPYANVSAATTANDCRAGRFCIPLEPILDRTTGRVRVRGIVRATVYDSGNNSITVGKELRVTSSAQYLNALTANTGTTPVKLVGIALEANSSTPSTPITMLVDFNGWDGIGSSGNTA